MNIIPLCSRHSGWCGQQPQYQYGQHIQMCNVFLGSAQTKSQNALVMFTNFSLSPSLSVTISVFHSVDIHVLNDLRLLH